MRNSAFLLFVVIFGSPNCGAQWTLLGEPMFSSNDVSFVSIDLDQSTGIPYVVYKESGLDGHLYCKKFVGGVWVDVGGIISDSVAGEIDLYCEFKINPVTNEPYVVYDQLFFSVPDSIIVKKFDGAGWVQVGNGIYGHLQSSIAFDPETGTPFLAERIIGDFYNVYPDTVEAFEYLFKYDSLANFWQPWANLELGTDNESSSMIINNAGDIYVSKEYEPLMSQIFQAHVADNTCALVSMNPFTGVTVERKNSELAYYEQDTALYGVLQRFDMGLPLLYTIEVVKIKDGTVYGVSGYAGDTLDIFHGGMAPSIEYNGFTNELWLSYLSTDPDNYGIVVRRWNGTSWELTADPYNSPELEYFDYKIDREKLAFDNTTGQAYVVFRHNNQASVITLGTTGIEENNVATNVSIFPNPSCGSFKILAKSKIEYISIFSDSGQNVLNQWPGSFQTQIDLPNSGVYFVNFQLQDGSTATEKLVVIGQ